MVGNGVSHRPGRSSGRFDRGERTQGDRHQALCQDREDSGRLHGGVRGAKGRDDQQGRGAFADGQAHRKPAHPAAGLQFGVQEGRESDGARVHQGNGLLASP